MKELLGTVFFGMITDENESAYFVQQQGVTFRLDKTEGDFQIGEAVEGFAYINQRDEKRFTTHIPKSYVGHYAYGTVVASRKDLGVFVDIGLPDKEMALSLDELPTMKELWPKKGDQLMVSLRVDDKERMWATLASEQIFHALSRQGNENMHNQNIEGIVFRLKLIGTYILTEDYYIGFIHPSEREREPRLGEQVTGRVIGVRADGVLNLSLKPRSYEVISDDAQMILTFLEHDKDKRIPYTDKSSPDAIKAMFAISKGQFKRALGSLMKQGKIIQKDGYTYLVETDEAGE